MNKSTLWLSLAVVVVVGLGIWGYVSYESKPGELDAFASCLGEKGATFYGAFWCPHCRAQKALFGRSVDKLPYVECSTPDGKNQTQVCIDHGINNYPTWVFADNSTSTGEQALATLAQKTGCELPATTNP